MINKISDKRAGEKKAISISVLKPDKSPNSLSTTKDNAYNQKIHLPRREHDATKRPYIHI